MTDSWYVNAWFFFIVSRSYYIPCNIYSQIKRSIVFSRKSLYSAILFAHLYRISIETELLWISTSSAFENIAELLLMSPLDVTTAIIYVITSLCVNYLRVFEVQIPWGEWMTWSHLYFFLRKGRSYRFSLGVFFSFSSAFFCTMQIKLLNCYPDDMKPSSFLL